MRRSELWTKTSKRSPRKEECVSSKLLIRAGFVNKLGAGLYSFLPLGMKVLQKIERIIVQEIERIGGQRILMPGLIPKRNWQKTGRWKEFETLFKLKGRGDQKYGLGPTHEEVIVPLAKKYISSYKDLPCYLYQIQDKFRDELRVKSGLLRTKEFLMKDLYSFHSTKKDLDSYYEKVKQIYGRIFARTGIGEKTYLTLASGGTFSKYSHEFQTVAPIGEDTIFICDKCRVGINQELTPGKNPKCFKCGKELKDKYSSIEVANIFKLNTRYSKPFNLTFTGSLGEKRLVKMGCYGIGLPRLMATIVEICHDPQGIIWPESVAPFQIGLVPIESTSKVKKRAEKIYRNLTGQTPKDGVLYDDREEKTPGEKLVDCDLVGVPWRIVVSKKTLAKESVELKKRDQPEVQLVKLSNLYPLLNSKIKNL